MAIYLNISLPVYTNVRNLLVQHVIGDFLRIQDIVWEISAFLFALFNCFADSFKCSLETARKNENLK